MIPKNTVSDALPSAGLASVGVSIGMAEAVEVGLGTAAILIDWQVPSDRSR
ncbi:hypothetical protein [Cupriavidus pinatubonensis]|uniref:hypothetical protein n=1 Tax=Cupriavidus pinatubonensis TaxID=248026 RepID=UPI001CC4AD32|nr:hypothetical protein [Cupriavidus pinatubonensis]